MFQLPGHDDYSLKVPSVLKSIELIYQYNPDEIFISTPGPLGLLGLLASYILNVKNIGMFNADFRLQASEVIKDEAIVNLLENYIRSFYSYMNEIRVPSKETMLSLENRGYDLTKMKVFREEIDSDLFLPLKAGEIF